jgi:hypothetical protein
MVPSKSSGSGHSEHWTLVQDTWKKLERLRKNGKVVIDGGSLDLASIVAVSRCEPDLCLKQQEQRS